MTALQTKELEILKEFISVCDSLNLTYYLVCGSALGTVKYKGFIPWDDDIDVAMPRNDYETFISCASNLLPQWCFIQNYHTDKYFHLVCSKLRDVGTTYVEYMCEKLDIKHGIFIDIFPLDGLHNNKSKLHYQKKMRLQYEAVRSLRLCYRRFLSRNIKYVRMNLYYILFKFFNLYSETNKYIEAFDDSIKQPNLSNSKIWCNHANSSSMKEYAPREQYGNGAWATFEGLKVRIPEDYDAYLTQKYGDWRADLPPEQQVGHHYAEVIDVNRPYTDYIVKLGKGKIRLKTSAELTRDGIPIPEGYKY